MHLYLITRGIKHDVDRLITELQGKYLPFKYPNEKGELIPTMVQCAVRPIQLYEIVFPEEHLDLMLTTLQGADAGNTQHKRHKKFIWAIRKMLGCKPIEKYKSDQALPIYRQNVDMNIIGTKKDYWVDTKTGKHIFNATEEQKKNCWEGL